jgi:hypothetical protein
MCYNTQKKKQMFAFIHHNTLHLQKLELWHNEKVQSCLYDELRLVGKQQLSHVTIIFEMLQTHCVHHTLQ